uniref:Uncharacterized protein n=1 Tax=Romanomermis culicivorax TaxID=13658 RepID=A0A915IW58_ROMCU
MTAKPHSNEGDTCVIPLVNQLFRYRSAISKDNLWNLCPQVSQFGFFESPDSSKVPIPRKVD